MQFSVRDNLYQASWISGPRHNFLAVELSEDNENLTPVVKILPAIGSCIHEKLKKDEIAVHVQEGVNEANQMFGTKYRVVQIAFVENDTPPEKRYGYLAFKIIERLASGGGFQEAK